MFLLSTLLAVVVAAMDFYAKQMAFTMGNAFLKTRVSHTGVTMLPTVTDKPESFRCGYCINWHTTVPRPTVNSCVRRLFGSLSNCSRISYFNKITHKLTKVE